MTKAEKHSPVWF